MRGAMTEVFNNAGALSRGWYLLARSGELPRGRAITRELLGRRVALWRGTDGRARALAARCPHLGANLGDGAVVGDDLRCPFHGWRFGEGGVCNHIPMMRTIPGFARTHPYPVRERWGGVFVWNGEGEPALPLPALEGMRDEDLAVLHLPPQVLGSHPHLVTCNGLDVQHWGALHELEFAAEPKLDDGAPNRLALDLTFRVRGHNRFERILKRLAGEIIRGRFTTWGANMATVEGAAGPVRLYVLFTHRPTPDGRSASRTLLFMPRARGLAGALGLHWLRLPATMMMLIYLLRRDRQLLDHLEFRPRLVEPDRPLRLFIDQVNALGAWEAPG